MSVLLVIKDTEGVAIMAEHKGPLGKTAVYVFELAAAFKIRHLDSSGCDGESSRETCNASRKARPRLSSPANRRALRCYLGI